MTEEEDDKDLNFDKILMTREIGAGSFGKVYEGHLPNNSKKRFAIKRINKKIFKDDEAGKYLLDALNKELECMKKCECKNSIKFYQKRETQNNYNVIMELCDSDLGKILAKRKNGFSAQEIRYIMSQLNNAFRKLQEHNIIHRDLNLANIFVTYTDETKTTFIPKLGDYGFSKIVKDSSTETHLGTPYSMAPEIMQNKPYDYKTDLWSIGVIIYLLHFKKIPFPGKNEKKILQSINERSNFEKAEDPQLRDLIDKLLVADPEKRLTWDEYFNHPFFKEDKVIEEIKKNVEKIKLEFSERLESIITPISFINKERYEFIKEFKHEIKDKSYKIYIALDKKTQKKVIIKSYEIQGYQLQNLNIKLDIELLDSPKENKSILKLINYIQDNKKKELVFEYVDEETLSKYIQQYDFNDENIQNFENGLLQNIYNLNQAIK